MTDPLSPAALHEAVQTLLAQASPAVLPGHHAFATIVDQDGAQLALAARSENGWSVEADAGYDWSGVQPGWQATIAIGKSW